MICVPVGKNESITVVPLGVRWVGVEESGRRSGRAKVRGNHQTHLEKRTWAAGAMPIGAPAKKRMSGGAATGTESVRTWMAGVGLAHDIGRQGTDGRNGDVVGGLGGELGHGRADRKGWGSAANEKSTIYLHGARDGLISNHTSRRPRPFSASVVPTAPARSSSYTDDHH